MTQKTAILITGMHRSGTSALARTIALLGAKLPDELIPANAGNPEGHWEPKAVVELNDRMLADAGSDVYSIANFSPDWFHTARAERFRSEATALIESAFGGDPFIVLKDPRTALFLPVWESALGAAGYRTVHVLPLRSPRQVASSLRRRHLKDFPYDGWAVPRGELVWLRYTLASVIGTRSLSRVFVRYDDLLADWRCEARRIADETGITWPRLGSLEAERSIDSFLHETEASEPSPLSFDVKAELATLSPSLLAEALYQTLASGDDRVAVDAIASEVAGRIKGMGELVSAFEAMYPVVWRYFEDASRSAAQIEAARRTEAGMHQAVQSLWANLNKQTDDKGSLRQLLETTSERARSFEAAFEQRVADLNRREAEFDLEREELKKFMGDLRGMLDHEVSVREDAEQGREALRSHAVELQRMREEEVSVRKDAEQGREALRSHAAELQRMLEEEVSVRKDAEQGREALRSHAAELQRSLEEEVSRRQGAEAALRAMDGERVASQSAIEAYRADIASIRSSWSWRLSSPVRVISRNLQKIAGRRQ